MTSLKAWRARRRIAVPGDDSGFTLLEAVVSLLVATVAFTALAAGAMSAIHGTMAGRQNQQAADFMARQIEQLRLIDFGGLANVDTPELQGDSRVTSCAGGGECVDPGTGTQERIVIDAGGSIDDHIYEVSGDEANRSRYTVRVYVTAPDWSQRDYYRRLTVIISWKDGTTTRTRSDSTMVAYTQRGLPLPVFKISPAGGTNQSVNPGATVVYGMNINNQGAPDRFDLTKSDSWDWDWYFDDGDGIWDPATDAVSAQEVVDTDGNGTIDTGRLDPNGSVRIWIRYDTSAIPLPLPSDPHTYDTVITATSVAQPLAPGGVKTLPFATTVGTGVVTATPTPTGTSTSTPTPSPSPTNDCTAASTATGSASAGYTLRSYTLHNDSQPGDTAAQQTLSMAVTAPYATTLYQYSTDVMANQQGRVLLAGGTAFPGTGSTDPSRVADWRFPVGRKAYSGTAAVNLWVAAPSSGSLTSVNLTAYVYKYTKVGSSYAATPLATIPLTLSPFTCGGFQQVGGQAAVSVPSSGSGSLGTNDWIGMRVVNSGTASTRIAYDVLSVYPAAVVLPES
jgi:type II secretory pathway pseudopilin PulG